MCLLQKIFPVICLMAGLPAKAAKQPLFSVANTIGSDMVIQQGKPFTLWGTGIGGTKITILADWVKTKQSATVNANGDWQLQLPVPKAVPGDYTPHNITLIAMKDTVVLSNILFGDVWMCSGQSNMDMEIKPFLPWLQGALNFQQEIAAANFPAIRLYNVRTDFKSVPQNDCTGGMWKICSPQTAGDFSAVAYFFAREIHNKLRIPIGLVVSSVGATNCQIWTSRETLAADPVLNEKILQPYDTSTIAREKLDSVVTFEKVLRPTLFYNAMIYPLRHLSLRGFLWYQGESNRHDGPLYTRLNAAMIRNWRSLFKQGDLPFYYVQVAPWKWEGDTTNTNYYAHFRQAQDSIRFKVKNTGMAVTMDIADSTDLHPRDKQNVGLRLANNALALTYGQRVPYLGPEYQRMEVAGRTVKVFFKPATIGKGLTTNNGAPPDHFFVAGKDQQFYKATARIEGDHVILQSPDVAEPVAVRYAFTNYPTTNFGNKDGLPAVPFRTDNW